MGERNSGPIKGSGSQGGQFIRRPQPPSSGWRQDAEWQRSLPPSDEQEQPPPAPRGSSGGLLKRPFPSSPSHPPLRRSQENMPPYEKAAGLRTRAPSGPSGPPERTDDLSPPASRGAQRSVMRSSPGWSS